MGDERARFIQAANNGTWNPAFTLLNGLSMDDMLRGLSALKRTTVDALVRRSSMCAAGLNMPRMMFAVHVVKLRGIPAQVPEDVRANGQVAVAQRFLARTNGKQSLTASPKSRAGQLFPTPEAAAFAAIDEILAASIGNNWEYAGRIFQKSAREKQYLYTEPKTRKSDHDSDTGPREQGNYVNIGTYHTHAGGFFDTDEAFSPDDKLKATLGRELAFMGTPLGKILRFTPVDLLTAAQLRDNPKGLVEEVRASSNECK